MSGGFVVPESEHDFVVAAAFRARGYQPDEVEALVRVCREAARHGIRTHHALKALHLDTMFGAGVGGCVPGATIEKLPSRFPAVEKWRAHRKSGPAVAYAAMDACLILAERFGTGTVAVADAWHYLWGGAYVLEAARRGFIGYTTCTAMITEVVPHGGRRAALGTNPHSWAFPESDATGAGFPILVDFATSAMAMGRVQVIARDGGTLPPGVAVDREGEPTTDPRAVGALLPFGAHKGFGMGLVSELLAATIGGGVPSTRGRFAASAGSATAPAFLFQAIHPEAISAGDPGTQWRQCLGAALEDITRDRNERVVLPGAPEAAAAEACRVAGGLIFTETEIAEFNQVSGACGLPPWDPAKLRSPLPA